MKVKQFQQLYGISMSGISEFDVAVQSVMVMTGKTEEQVNKMTISRFNRICKRVAKVFDIKQGNPPYVIRANGKWYRVMYDVSKLPAARYVEGMTYGDPQKMVENLHTIMASCVQPMTWYGKLKPYDATKHAEYAADMLEADFSKVYNTALFFYQLFNALMRASQPFIAEMLVKRGVKEEEVQALHGLINAMDGFSQRKRSQN